MSLAHTGKLNIPPGVITAFASSTIPNKWLLCDGSAVSRSDFAQLFDVIGIVYGAGDGSTTFNIPDLRQRFPLGKAVTGTGATLGGVGGAIDHDHTIAHTHQIDPPSTTTSAPTGTSGQLVGVVSVASATHTHSVDIAAFTSGAASVANSGATNPPFQTVNFIIKT